MRTNFLEFAAYFMVITASVLLIFGQYDLAAVQALLGIFFQLERLIS